METLRRNRLDLNTPAELAIYNAIQEVEKMGADGRLTNAIIVLNKVRNLVADFIDDQQLTQKAEKLFLLQYHLSRRNDEGWNNVALVSALDFDSAKQKLINQNTYRYQDALDSRDVIPDHIKNLNID